ncbi:MAG: phosphoribosylformylglycinamidine cyclo-ligase [Oligoflexia bacterium]|nr:phosphoribosylformylglycinamidine cyclo-ligase [Oligoflexia bacterium]MBF0364652.1 phosphoribosylformylglycinamidine cyclo-ligase [Oligoflexia bacterium]
MILETHPASIASLENGDLCSKIAYTHALSTSAQAFQTSDGPYAGIVEIAGAKIGITSDGIGTKAEIAERLKKYDTLGFDLVAMVADDLIASGVRPLYLSNILDVNTLNPQVIDELMQGLAKAAIYARTQIVGGEIAGLSSRVQGYGEGTHFNWSATAIGDLLCDKPISGIDVKTGDLIIALKEEGIRSNGLTLARTILQNQFGNEWHLHQGWGDYLLTPSRIYAPFVVDVITKASIAIHGIAHITGGSFKSKLGRVLKATKLSALIDHPFAAPAPMLALQELGAISDHEAYRHWNMGHGMLLLVPALAADKILSFALKQNLQAQVIGSIEQLSKPQIVINLQTGKTVIYEY